MRNTILTMMLLLLGAGLYAQGEVWTLQRCIQYAYENNLTIKQSEIYLDIADNSVLQAKLGMLPSLSGYASHGFNFGNSVDPTTYRFTRETTQSSSFGISGGLSLFTSMQQLNAVKKAKLDKEQAGHELTAMKDNVSLTLASYYLAILSNKGILENMNKQLETTRSQLNQTKRLVDAGALPKGDLLDIDAQLAMDEYNLVNAQNLVDISLLRLKMVLQLPPEQPFDIIAPDINAGQLLPPESLNPNSIYKEAVTTMPAIKSAETGLKSAEKSLHIARGNLYPTISMSANLSSTYFSQAQEITGSTTPVDEFVQIGFLESNQSEAVVTETPDIPVFGKIDFGSQLKDNFRQSVSFNMALPIFSGWSNRLQVENAKLNILGAKYQLDEAKNTLVSDITQAHADAVAAHKTYEASMKNSTALQKSFDNAQQKYNLGAMNALDFLMVKNNLSVSQSEQLRSRYDYIFKLKVLDFYQGKPIIDTP